MKAIRILIKGNKKPRVFIEYLKSYKNSRYGGEDGIRTHGMLLTYTAFPMLRLKPSRPPLRLRFRDALIHNIKYNHLIISAFIVNVKYFSEKLTEN